MFGRGATGEMFIYLFDGYHSGAKEKKMGHNESVAEQSFIIGSAVKACTMWSRKCMYDY